METPDASLFAASAWFDPIETGIRDRLQQSICSLPKKKCEKSQYNGGQSRNGTVIISGGHASTGNVHLRSTANLDEQVEFFMKGVVGLGILAVLYTILKRFRRAVQRHK